MIIIPDTLIYFGLGVLFIEAMPILEALINLIIQFISMLQGFLAIKITQQSAQITSIKNDATKFTTSVRPIGFTASYEDDEEDYEEYESEDE